VSLPRQPCVDDLLLEFREWIWSKPASSCPPKRDEDFPSYLIGIKAYFEQYVLYPSIQLTLTWIRSALGASLLYRFERPQYADIIRKYAYGPDVPVEQVKTNSKLYGAEHLLRLLGMSMQRHLSTSNLFYRSSFVADSHDVYWDGQCLDEYYPRLDKSAARVCD
jgi:mortality factor 4-like protein 1